MGGLNNNNEEVSVNDALKCLNEKLDRILEFVDKVEGFVDGVSAMQGMLGPMMQGMGDISSVFNLGNVPVDVSSTEIKPVIPR